MRNHDRQMLGFPAGIHIQKPGFHSFSGFSGGEHPGKQWKLDGREGEQLIGGADELRMSDSRGKYGNRDVKEAEIGVLAIENQDNGGVEADDGGAKREGNDAFLPIHAQKRPFFGHKLEHKWNSNGIRIDIPRFSIRCASESLRSASLLPPP